MAKPTSTDLHVYAHGGNSHILCALYGSKVGQALWDDVLRRILEEEVNLNITPEDFVACAGIKDLKPIDQTRRWIFFNQILFVRRKIQKDFYLRWNRNKTLVSTVNQSAENGVLYMDFGGGEIKVPGHAEKHDASELLRTLDKGDETDVKCALVRLSELVGKLMSQAAKDGHLGFEVICLCTGKYWKEIIEKHERHFNLLTFTLRWIDSDEERDYEFIGSDEAFEASRDAVFEVSKAPVSSYIGNITSGGSSSEIWVVEYQALGDGSNWIQKYPIPHGANSDLFDPRLPSVAEMESLFEDCLEPPPLEEEAEVIQVDSDDEVVGRTMSGAPW